MDVAHRSLRHQAFLGELVRRALQEIPRIPRRQITPVSRDGQARQGADNWPDARFVPLSFSLQKNPSHEELLSRLSIIIISRPSSKVTRLTIIITGKYQLAVFPEAGHFVHEDQPAKTAQIVADFYRRNDRTALVLPPKVGDILKDKTGQGGKGVLK
jgi:hypothetical protein